MFANLTDKLTKALRDLRGLSKLTEENIAPALTEVRSALMSADVNFKVAKDFTERVKVACLGQAVIESVNPGQMAVKIVSDELTKLLGEAKDKAMGAVKDQAAAAAKGMFGKFFGR